MISSAGLPSPPPSAMRSWFPQLLYLASPAWARPSPPQPWLSRGRGRWGPNSCGTTVNRKKKKKKHGQQESAAGCSWRLCRQMRPTALTISSDLASSSCCFSFPPSLIEVAFSARLSPWVQEGVWTDESSLLIKFLARKSNPEIKVGWGYDPGHPEGFSPEPI